MDKYYIKSLSGGGIMPNYKCSAACRHCVYGSSPHYPNEYMDADVMAGVCSTLKSLSCYGVHIGGGEPFLNFGGLLQLVENIRKSGLALDYIETNASWCVDEEKSREKIKALLDAGADTLMISADPYHLEFVPLEKPLRLLKLCRELGMGYFIWKQGYLNQFLKNNLIDISKKYSRKELENILGRDYILETAQSYGLSYNGRALCILREYGKPVSTKELIKSAPCRELTNTGHFHVDLYGNFIAPGCSGIGVPLDKISRGIGEDEYPIAGRLYHRGVVGLLELASQYGFIPDESYYGKCDLCVNIRAYLSESDINIKELSPKEYYRYYLYNQ